MRWSSQRTYGRLGEASRFDDAGAEVAEVAERVAREKASGCVVRKAGARRGVRICRASWPHPDALLGEDIDGCRLGQVPKRGDVERRIGVVLCRGELSFH